MGAGEPSVECRRATGADWSQIWPIVSATLRRGDTYTHPPDLGEDHARTMWMLDGDRAATYVALLGEDVVGTARLEPNHPGLGDHVANAGWMIAPRSIGRGIGRQLAEYVMEEARRFGYRGMQFNAVVATNARAIALWESLGFEIVGTVPRAFRHATDGPVAIHVMYRDL